MTVKVLKNRKLVRDAIDRKFFKTKYKTKTDIYKILQKIY